ncbi:LCP family protein [Pseudonocardia sp. ICBG1293]|uniref:LCP family protein n=1 Tax=Pseudonocardia sp. ICBG1293 TaxID=2844382 RepID=UPI001CCEFF64|nr:LCP family protein [Pseudonocardia sp. ICBG1293]
MQDGDDEVRRTRRTRRRPDDAAPPAPQGSPDAQPPTPATHPSGPQRRPGAHPSGPRPEPGTHPSGPQPRTADTPPPPVPPSGVRRVRGGPVPRRPGEQPARRGPHPRDGGPSRATPVPPASGRPTRPAPPVDRPTPAPGPGPGTGSTAVPTQAPGTGTPRPGPGTLPPDARADATARGSRPGPAPAGAHPGTPDEGPQPAGPTGTDRRGAADSRVTEVFDALGPRRRRRRYRDDPPADDAGVVAEQAERAAPEEAPPVTTEPEPADTPPPGRAAPRAWRIGAAVAAALVLVTTAFGFAGRSEVHDGVRTVAALAPDTDAILDAEAQSGDRNVLVLGLQADRAGTAESARTDTAVLVHRPAGGGPAVTLSIPATLEVSRPPCRRFDPATGGYGDTVPAESRTAFATAYDVGGPACSVGVVQQLTSMPMSGFVALDLAGAPELVDAVGGIAVCTERPVVDPVLGPVVEGSGTVELDGATAVRFASAAGTADSSPANRVRRQQRVVAAALGDALSTTSLLTPGAPGRSAAGVSSALAADGVDAREILTLARGLARSGAAADDDTPAFLSVPVSDAPNTRGQLELRRPEARALFSALREHEPLPESATAPASRSAAAPAAGTVVTLVDATGRPGAADRVAADLRERGYEIGAVTIGPAAPGAQVRYSPDNTDAAGTLVDALPGARPLPDPTGSRVLELVVGAGDAAPVQAVPSDDVDCD